MVEGENNKVSVSQTTGKKQDDKVEINVNYWLLWDEIKNFKSFFNWNDFAAGIVFELIPSVCDMGSDFALAGVWSKKPGLERKADVTYMYLSMAGMVMGMKTIYNRVLRRCCASSFTDYWICKFVGYIILIALVGLIIYGVIFVADSWVLFATAIMTSIFILSTKILRVLIHGLEMKKLSVKMSSVEAQHESTFQLLLISYLIIHGKVKLGTSEIMGIISSFVMIGKSGAESLLTFGKTNKLEDKGFWEKWKLLLSLTPVLTMTCLFRVMTKALLPGLLSLLTFALPLVVVLLLKICLPSLSSLTPLDIFQGAVSEFSIPSIWGHVGREKSRSIQLGFAIFHLLVNTLVLVVIIWDPSMMVFGIKMLFIISFDEVNVSIARPVAMTALVCGWISFPLHMYQIYWAECWDKLQILATV